MTFLYFSMTSGDAKIMPIDIVNQSNKTIFASLVEDEVHYLNQVCSGVSM